MQTTPIFFEPVVTHLIFSMTMICKESELYQMVQFDCRARAPSKAVWASISKGDASTWNTYIALAVEITRCVCVWGEIASRRVWVVTFGCVGLVKSPCFHFFYSRSVYGLECIAWTPYWSMSLSCYIRNLCLAEKGVLRVDFFLWFIILFIVLRITQFAILLTK